MTPRTALRCAIPAAAILLLAACQTAPEPNRATDAPAAPSPETETAAVAPRAAIPPASKEPEIDAPDPAAMIGWRGDDLSRTLGNATLVRRDLGTEIWQYRAPDCVLFVFFYTRDGAPAVEHVESRGDGTPATCVRSVMRARLKQQAG